MARTAPVNTGYNIINGTSTGFNAAYVDCWLEWKVLEQSVTANTSKVRVILYAAATTSSSTAWNLAENFGFVGYNGGNRQYRSTTYNFANYAVNCFGDYTFTISHESDGAKTVTLEGAWSTSHSSYISGGKVSGAVALPTIARASTIGASDANIGADTTITINYRDASYTHSIAYQFGTLTGHIGADGNPTTSEARLSNKSIAFHVPTAFYAQIPNDPSGVCTLTCRTYLGDTQIGAEQTGKFTATAKESDCRPEVTGAVVDSNEATKALTGDENRLVKYHSTALCTISATARNGATIKSKSIAGTAVPGNENTRSIEKVETGSFEFVATDSRGYAAKIPISKSLVPYVQLSCTVKTARRDGPTTGNATLELEGKYFNGSFGAVDNALTVTYRVRQQGGVYGKAFPVTPEFTEGGWLANVTIPGLEYTDAWEIEVTAEDKLEAVSKTVTVTRGIPVFDWGENDFNFNVPVTAPSFNGMENEFFKWRGNCVSVDDSYLSGIYRLMSYTQKDENVPDDGILLVYNCSDNADTGMAPRLQIVMDYGGNKRKLRMNWFGTEYPWRDF